MSLPSNHKIELNRPDAFATLADFKAAVVNAIARCDERALNDLYEQFAVDDQGARRISFER